MKINKFMQVKILVIAVFLFLSSCLGERMLHKTYPGEVVANDRLAVFNWEGTWYMGLGLYKSDGIPFTGTQGSGTWPCMYNDRNHGGFNVAVLPGKRVFEFFNAKTEPVSVFQVSFNMDAGKTYTLVGNEDKFVIMCDGKEVKADTGKIPVYTEPGTGNPHGLLKIGITDDGMAVALFRVDGKAANPMHKLHPKWVIINEQGLWSIKDIELRFTPGKHSIEYVVLYKRIGGFGIGFSVKTLEFNVSAGKTYTYKVIPDPEDGKSGELEHTIEIVPE